MNTSYKKKAVLNLIQNFTHCSLKTTIKCFFYRKNLSFSFKHAIHERKACFLPLHYFFAHSNLPHNITTSILSWGYNIKVTISDQVFVVQRLGCFRIVQALNTPRILISHIHHQDLDYETQNESVVSSFTQFRVQ